MASNLNMKIQPLKSSRDSVKKTKLQKAYRMVPFGTTLFIGRTGSGKSVAIANIISNRHMLKGYYDIIYLFCLSPCRLLQEHGNIPDKRVFMDDDPEKLQNIIDAQKKYIETHGFKQAPHILIILDDILNGSFMQHKSLKELFFAGTHFKTSTYLCSQNYKSILRKYRLNFHACLYFHGCTKGDNERICEEMMPNTLNKEDFFKVIKYCTDEPYSFMFINLTNPNKKKSFMKNFEEQLIIS